VPPAASVWYYFRENDYDRIKALWEVGDTMSRGAAMMTGTTVESRVLGSAWPLHGNRALAEAIHANIVAVGAPPWSETDQQFARMVQRSLQLPERGLVTQVAKEVQGTERMNDEEKLGGPSDDIGDVMWTAPTGALFFPANIPGVAYHNWAAAIAMATPVAHKGATQGAKVHAMTIIDLMMRPELVSAARHYFETVQAKQAKYRPLIRPQDLPAIWLNKETMDRFRPELRKHYYDPARFKTYLEQLNVPYPPAAAAGAP
jgi:aminobenzoyl-glutamate utilization protein B